MIKPQLSVIAPAYNEEGNIAQLIERIAQSLIEAKIQYEIIIVDDDSTDQTVAIAKQYQTKYPVRIYSKVGQKKSKAQSIIEGIAYARAKTVAMIDADLQYPPEKLPEMFAKMQTADLIVATRTKKHTSFVRTFVSNVYHTFFNKFLLGLSFDVQSGLKMFSKEMFQRITLHPTPWTFDLELLVQAQHAGYRLDTVDIEFAPRTAGEAKVNLVKTSWEIGRHAFKTKFQERLPIAFHPTKVKEKGPGFHYKGNPYMPHNDLHMHQTTLETFTIKQIIQIFIWLTVVVLLFIIDWKTTLTFFVGAMTILYFADLLYWLYLSIRSIRDFPEIQIADEDIKKLKDADLPVYTVFCPLYKEWEVLPQFTEAMSNLDYPKDKLQVMLLLEEDDAETVQHARNMNLPDFFEIVVTPHAKPKTKPKACNYGLKFTRGEYVVIYDAEDVPDRDQLKKALIAFDQVPDNIICIQAKLNFYNSTQNLLTRLFTAEYSLWFDLVLSGLHSVSAPIPLGGTSNHFKTLVLREIGGWDAFNVTEDCDLGMRLAKKGMLTAVMESLTLEEANSDYGNWFKQRSRWIKGYIQTFIVHLRDLKSFTSFHKISFLLIVGGKTLSMFANPFMWLITISYFTLRAIVGETIESFYPAPILYMGVISLIFGNFLYLYYYMIGCAKRGQWEIIPFVFLVPFYWLAMSASAWYALYKLITAPHHWYKTKHGLHLKQNANSVQNILTEQTQAIQPAAVQG